MSDLVRNLASDLNKQIKDYRPELGVREVGNVLEAGDGIARVSGLTGVLSQELVQFANGVMGIAFSLEENSTGIIIMGEFSGVEEGMEVFGTGRIASVPTGEAMIGRVVDALGQPIDGHG